MDELEDRNKPRGGQNGKPEQKRSPRKGVELDSDDEATEKMQAVMNCVYMGMFLMIGGIFVW